MISKNLIKLVKSLEVKKYRQREKLFVAEGPKVVGDLMQTTRPHQLIATATWYERNRIAPDVTVDDEELRRTSLLQHPQEVIGLFPLPSADETFSTDDCRRQLVLALDGVQDPGNMGTIIRLCDWFGIEHMVCSPTTADAYNPKVVQATMGSIARVKVHYMELPPLLEALKGEVPVYGTLLDGEDIYQQTLTAHGVIVMGNEGKGISEEVRPLVSHRLFIPSYPAGRVTAESLNVAIATAITCAEFRRRG